MPDGLECALPLEDDLHRGLENYVWAPGIPQECYACFRNLAKVVGEELFEVEDREEYDEEPNGFYYIGMKATGVYSRAAAEDVGLDDGLGDEGPLTSRTLYEFECPKANPLNPPV